MAIKGVFFDLGGTLFTYRNIPRQHGALLEDTATRLGLPESRGLKKAYAEAMAAMSAAYAERDYYLHRDLFREAFTDSLARIGRDAPAPLVDWYLEAHRESVFGSLEMKPDCVSTLQGLRARGQYLCIVSNIDNDMLDPLVTREGLDQYLHHWTSSETARSCKPHRDFFELCLRQAGLDARDVLFVGDSPEHDIAGASALGMRTALITDEGMPPPLQAGKDTREPDHRIDRLSQLLDIVAS